MFRPGILRNGKVSDVKLIHIKDVRFDFIICFACLLEVRSQGDFIISYFLGGGHTNRVSGCFGKCTRNTDGFVERRLTTV